ncbi:MAG: hypothetical protein ACPGQT_00630 [Rhodothermales bacterium]
MTRIPFTLPDVGLREIEGMVWVDDEFLVIQLTNKLFGLIDGDTDVIKIEATAIQDIRIQRRPFKDRLVITPKKHELLDILPGKHANDVRLRIWRTQRQNLDRLLLEVLALQKSARRDASAG